MSDQSSDHFALAPELADPTTADSPGAGSVGLAVTRRCSGGDLPALTDDETTWVSRLYIALAVIYVGAFFYMAMVFWIPAHPGVDQNGYLVGGKQFAQTLSMGLTPANPFSFVGRMWIGTADQIYYPKYPLGLPLIYAIGLWIGGASYGVDLIYLLSPVCLTLALLGCFFLIRLAVPSFYALLGMVTLSTSPVMLWCLNNPNSHASTLVCVVWGMFLLIRWWQTGGLARARGAGLLIGYAATIRYTEGLLVLPLLLVVATKIWGDRHQPRHPPAAPLRVRSAANPFSTRRQGLVLLTWWALPILVLVTFNLAWFGALTGYDSTGESTGFSWGYFVDNWETMLRQFQVSALFFMVPLAVIGLAFMYAFSGRLALFLTAWIIPTVVLYTAYYWAPDSRNADGLALGYMRFFLTVLPALLLAAMWFIRFAARSVVISRQAAIGLTTALVIGLIALNVIAWKLGAPLLAWLKLDQTRLFSATWDQPTWKLLHIAAVGVALVILAGLLWWMQHLSLSPLFDTTRSVGVLIASLAAWCASAVQLFNAAPMLLNDYRSNLSTAKTGQIIQYRVPAGSVIFAPQSILHHLQLIGAYELYDPNQFRAAFIRQLKTIDPDEPNALQYQRAQYLIDLFDGQNDTQLQVRENGIIRRALNRGQQVYYLGNRRTLTDWARAVTQAQKKQKDDWTAADDQRELILTILHSPTGAAGLTAQILSDGRWADAPAVELSAGNARGVPRGPASRRPPLWQRANENVLIRITALPPVPPAT